MCSADEVQVMTVEKLADHIGPEGEGNSPIVLPPALDIFVWVWPQQVTQQAWHKTKHEAVTDTNSQSLMKVN